MHFRCQAAEDELAGDSARGPEALREAIALLIAAATAGCSGADIGSVCDEAALAALREDIGARWVEPRHVRRALQRQEACAALRHTKSIKSSR